MLVGDLMQRFCETDGYCSSPFYQAGWLVATDRRVLIRRRSDAPDTTDRRVPTIGPVMSPIAYVVEWHQWPEVSPCEACDRTGWKKVPCSSCGGTGICTCHCGDEHDCGCEDGAETHACDCRTVTDAIDMGGTMFARHYVWLVGQLGKVEWGIAPGSSLLFFRWPDGEGVLTGLDTHKEQT